MRGELMAAEMAEQPAVLAALAGRRAEVVEHVRACLPEPLAGVMLVARGSSDYAAVYGRYLLEVHAGVPGALASPSVATHYRSRLDLSDTLVVSVSQSGATEEIVATQQWARDCGAATIAVANAADSPLVASADLALVTSAGPELAVPATKTYLTQLAAMCVLGTALAPEPTALDDDLTRAADEVERLLASALGVDAAVAVLRDAEHVVVSGRGLLMGTALETALKLEETCLRPVRGYSYADLRHGPMSVVTSGVTAVLVAAKDGPLLAALVEIARDLGDRGATTVGIGGDEAFAQACAVHVPGPDLVEPVAPLGMMVPAQLVVERLARELGLDPDNPRGLAKVTRTDPTDDWKGTTE